METKKEPEVENIEKEAEHAPQDTEPIPITIAENVMDITPSEQSIPEEQRKSPHTTPKPDRGKGIARDNDESPRKLVKSSTKVRQDPDTLMLIPYEINGVLYHLTNEQIQAHLEKEERTASDLHYYTIYVGFLCPLVASLEMGDDVDIRALTIKQYIALIPDDIRPGIVNPKIGDDVEFEINANFMRELRRKRFGTNDEDAYEHVYTVLEILDLFHFPDVTHDAIMLRVFPITLKGRALRWKDRLPAGYNDPLYQCPFHDLNCQHKVHIFYTGLDIPTRKILDPYGFIPLMTPTQDLESIQVMADHSHNWYDETTTMERINDDMDCNTLRIQDNAAEW
ncbi:hypothetical protein Tco_1270421 [Tanacetum coccineum]